MEAAGLRSAAYCGGMNSGTSRTSPESIPPVRRARAARRRVRAAGVRREAGQARATAVHAIDLGHHPRVDQLDVAEQTLRVGAQRVAHLPQVADQLHALGADVGRPPCRAVPERSASAGGLGLDLLGVSSALCAASRARHRLLHLVSASLRALRRPGQNLGRLFLGGPHAVSAGALSPSAMRSRTRSSASTRSAPRQPRPQPRSRHTRSAVSAPLAGVFLSAARCGMVIRGRP